MLVLEPTFNAEAMATALGIPSGKHILRRHLAEEMSAIFPPARCVWAAGYRAWAPEQGGPDFPAQPLAHWAPRVPHQTVVGLRPLRRKLRSREERCLSEVTWRVNG